MEKLIEINSRTINQREGFLSTYTTLEERRDALEEREAQLAEEIASTERRRSIVLQAFTELRASHTPIEFTPPPTLGRPDRQRQRLRRQDHLQLQSWQHHHRPDLADPP